MLLTLANIKKKVQ